MEWADESATCFAIVGLVRQKSADMVAHVIRKVLLRQVAITNYVNPF